MKMSIEKVRYYTDNLELDIPKIYRYALNFLPDVIDEVCNGVGSETSWTYHFTPDTIWGLNINPASHPHDWGFTFPLEFEATSEGISYMLKLNQTFAENCKKLFKDGWSCFYWLRCRRLEKYKTALRIGSPEAFWSNKILPKDFHKYYSFIPEFNKKEYEKLKGIYVKIRQELGLCNGGIELK